MQTIKLKYKIALGLVIFLMAVVVGIGVANHPDLRQSLAISDPPENLVYLPLVSNFVAVQVLPNHRAYVESGTTAVICMWWARCAMRRRNPCAM